MILYYTMPNAYNILPSVIPSAIPNAIPSVIPNAIPSAEELIIQFKRYSVSHPNLANCWIAYLGLKKRHWHSAIAKQAIYVLHSFEQGKSDFKKNDILSLLLYNQVMI